MIKNLSPTHLLLITLAAVLLILSAVAFRLLQDPSASSPFITPQMTGTSTALPTVPGNTTEPTVPTPTRQTSYTPLAANKTPNPSPPTPFPPPGQVTRPGLTGTPTNTLPANTTPRRTPSPPVATASASTSPSVTQPGTTPSATITLSPGEFGVTGRLIQNGTPVPSVVVTFADDSAPRQAATNQGGHYWFITLAPGTDFTLTYDQADNPDLTPAAQVASLAYLKGTLPLNQDIIDLPDIELSLNLNGMLFELIGPVDGAAYSAASISDSSKLQFTWSLYNQGGSYHIELGQTGSEEAIWTSGTITSSTYSWNGTLDDGLHITEGTYWWRVGVTKSAANYVEVIYTQPFDLMINP